MTRIENKSPFTSGLHPVGQSSRKDWQIGKRKIWAIGPKYPASRCANWSRHIPEVFQLQLQHKELQPSITPGVNTYAIPMQGTFKNGNLKKCQQTWISEFSCNSGALKSQNRKNRNSSNCVSLGTEWIGLLEELHTWFSCLLYCCGVLSVLWQIKSTIKWTFSVAKQTPHFWPSPNSITLSHLQENHKSNGH